jgi:hypothetical protein
VPIIIRYDHEIVAERGQDSFFLQLTPQRSSIVPRYDEPTRQVQLEWFRGWDLAVEMSCQIGWISGDSGRYHVGFSGWDDPLLRLWCQQFETEDGDSLHPDLYVMQVYPHDQYLKDLATGRLEPDDDP